MQKILFLLLFIGSLGYQINAQNNMDTLSYSVGVMMAQGLKSQGLDQLNAQDLANAIDDVLKGKQLKVSEAEAEQVFRKHLQEQKAAQYKDNVAQGEKFLAENGARKEVTTLPSGLQYEIINEGTGAKPGRTSNVTVHYHGTLIDGTVFDSSIERGQPASFGVNQVIAGWTEALQLMPQGSKWRLFIPYNLAYGERSAGPKIGPFSTLIFDVELLDIK